VEALRKERAEATERDGRILELAVGLSTELGGAAALARELELSRQYVGRILRGERPVTPEFERAVEALARRFAAETEFLVVETRMSKLPPR
jgi:transcriptional regulator with XRE-family HTH domain